MHVSNDRACNKKKNLRTAETKTDMILLLQSMVLYIHVFAQVYPNVYTALDRLSSRYAAIMATESVLCRACTMWR
jgi:hypothetical protein